MHWPGYVQGGQEASFGYLLLGVYNRRIPGDTLVLQLTSFSLGELERRQIHSGHFVYF
jgi:hypothetical protein